MDGFPDQTAAAAPRTIDTDRRSTTLGLTGVYNFRDLAGAQGSHGPLRRGLIYRSDGINRCCPDETQIIADLGIRRILDLRTNSERDTDGVFLHPDIVTVHIPMIETFHELGDRADELGDRLMPEFYLGIAAANSGAIALCIAEIITSATDDEPLLVHCTAGKDRTGIVAALALAVAGVDDHQIAIDYARSNDAIPLIEQWYRERRGAARSDRLTELGFDEEQRAQFNSASPATMLEFLSGIRRHYGSVEDYLVWGGTDRAELDRCRRVFS